jgi:hypothetical protein
VLSTIEPALTQGETPRKKRATPSGMRDQRSKHGGVAGAPCEPPLRVLPKNLTDALQYPDWTPPKRSTAVRATQSLAQARATHPPAVSTTADFLTGTVRARDPGGRDHSGEVLVTGVSVALPLPWMVH